MMNKFALVIDSNPTPTDLQFLEDQINRFNIATTGYDDFQWLTCFVRDDAGGVVSGIIGFTWGQSCRIQVLWVQPALQGQGYGTALLLTAEEEARRRGCQVIVLESHSFQAPNFYRKHGYTEAGFRPDYPQGYGDYFFYKRLG